MALSEDEKSELVAYLDGELDDAATQAVEAKLTTNAEARAELDALKQTWGLLDLLPKASPSANFTNRTMERLSLEKVGHSASKTLPMHGNSFLGRMAWVAAILVALGGGYYAANYLWNTPQDPITEDDLELIRHLRIAEKWRYYENTDDLDFVKKLNAPDLFGDDPS